MELTDRDINVMVIDDTPGNLELLDDILSGKNYEVRLFPAGNLGLRSAKNNPPDLILLDIMMPDMDGYEVCKELKKNQILRDIPVIFISAKGEIFDKVKAFESGGVDYITKPFQVEEVVARVDAHIKIRSYQLALEEKNQILKKALDELAETQNQLIQKEKMASLGTLTAGIAHEINNPINAVNSSSISLDRFLKKLFSLIDYYNELLVNKDNDTEQLIKSYKDEIDYNNIIEGINVLTGNIRNGAERTANIVENLKIFTHIDQAEKKAVNIHRNIDSSLELLKSKFKGKLNIKKNYGEIPNIVCYAGKMNQVFINLFSNAISAIEDKEIKTEKEEIIITTELTADNQLMISVRDTGIGIPKDKIKRIFEPFYTTKSIGSGTGLGLSITHGIIRSHSGTINVTSEIGKGTTFTILIPIVAE